MGIIEHAKIWNFNRLSCTLSCYLSSSSLCKAYASYNSLSCARLKPCLEAAGFGNDTEILQIPNNLTVNSQTLRLPDNACVALAVIYYLCAPQHNHKIARSNPETIFQRRNKWLVRTSSESVPRWITVYLWFPSRDTSCNWICLNFISERR